ncbi:MAG: ferric reductase-like transmembrane domain-containing protein [Ottowia sp.]|nr:ferric reductase-like transmembrane domain-containing protein [Ottowia sp.]
MRNIRIALWGFPLALLALWLLAEPMGLFPQPFTYFGFRGGAVQLSGVLAMGAMTACMVLATRARVLETLFGGLDKMYRLHKWMGIMALVTGTLHWWLAKGTKWMVRWGWLERPQRGPRPGGGGGAPSVEGLQAWLRGQRHLVETVGEWVFYAAAIMLILALIKRFPYKIFAKTHKWIAVGYLLLVWHSFVLFKFQNWGQPIGLVMLAMLIVGTISALWTLFGRTGASRKLAASVSSIKYSEPLRTTFFSLAVPKGWPGHEAGQFAFVRAGEGDEPHPYTIASAWDDKKRELQFAVRVLGDYTARLPKELREGQDVQVEGPYGRFTFEDGTLHQIWIGGGIGITPFLARLQQLAAKGGDGRSIDLFHSTREEDPEFLARLQQMADAAGVRLHVLIDGKDGFLNVERLLAAVPEWRQASVWFCGPAGFGDKLREGLLANGVLPGRWHQELFEMR